MKIIFGGIPTIVFTVAHLDCALPRLHAADSGVQRKISLGKILS